MRFIGLNLSHTMYPWWENSVSWFHVSNNSDINEVKLILFFLILASCFISIEMLGNVHYNEQLFEFLFYAKMGFIGLNLSHTMYPCWENSTSWFHVSDNSGAPLQPVITFCKMRTCLPSLKSKIEKDIKSWAVYKIVCPGCSTCYVGQTSWHLITRFKEHRCNRNQTIRAHFDKCTHCAPTLNDVKILASKLCSLNFLLTSEALYIVYTRP